MMPKSLMDLWDAPASFGLGSHDFLVMAALDSCGGDGAPMSEMVEAAERGVGKPLRRVTLYAAVDKLVHMGLLAVTGSLRSPNGGRPQRVLSLTETGRLALKVGEGIAESLSRELPVPVGEDLADEAVREGPRTSRRELVTILDEAGLLGSVEAVERDGTYVVRPLAGDVANSRETRHRIRRAFSGRRDVHATGNSGRPFEGEPVDLSDTPAPPGP